MKNTLAHEGSGRLERRSGRPHLFKGPVGHRLLRRTRSSAAKVADRSTPRTTTSSSFLAASWVEQVLDKKGVTALATLPSLDQLRGKIIGLLQAPATKIAGVLQAPAGQLARVLSAYATKDAA